MTKIGDWLERPARDARVAAQADVVVVGGGPAGLSAALAAAQRRPDHPAGALQPFGRPGFRRHGAGAGRHVGQPSARDLGARQLPGHDRAHGGDGAGAFPRSDEWGEDPAAYRRWGRWGTFDFHSQKTPHPICFAAAFDPDAYKRVALEMVQQAGVQLRLHSWFSQALVDGERIKGVICETKNGSEAILADMVIDATGDLDVAASAGAPHISDSYITTTVFRLGGVDTEAAARYEREEPEAYAELDRQIKRVLGGSWGIWWMKTPLPGVVWCNCPHMAGIDGLKVEDLTRAEIVGRQHIHALVDFVRGKLPGFEHCFVVDVAPQTGVRQTRLLDGEYVMTKEDVVQRVRFDDSIARGRDYYYPFRALLPRRIDNLLVAGRHYSATSQAQKISREIPVHGDGRSRRHGRRRWRA